MHGPNALIVVVVDCNDDIKSDKAYRLAAQADPRGKRTIVVLNKMNTLRGENGARVAKLLGSRPGNDDDDGDDVASIIGYFGIAGRTPDQARQGASLVQAKEEEKELFRQHWVLADTEVQQHCGSDALLNAIVGIWSGKISAAMPGVERALADEIGDEKNEKKEDESEDVDEVDELARAIASASLGVSGDLGQPTLLERLKEAERCAKDVVVCHKNQ